MYGKLVEASDYELNLHPPEEDTQDVLDSLDSVMALEEVKRKAEEDDFVAAKQKMLNAEKGRIHSIVASAFAPLASRAHAASFLALWSKAGAGIPGDDNPPPYHVINFAMEQSVSDPVGQRRSWEEAKSEKRRLAELAERSVRAKQTLSEIKGALEMNAARIADTVGSQK